MLYVFVLFYGRMYCCVCSKRIEPCAMVLLHTHYQIPRISVLSHTYFFTSR